MSKINVARSLVATLAALTFAALSPPPAEAAGRCYHLAPVCHVGERALCLCSSASDFSCAWSCGRVGQ